MAAAGFVLRSSRCPSKPPVHRPPGAKSAAAVKASWTGSARARRAGATVPAGAGRGPPILARHPLCVRVPGRRAHEPATIVDHIVPHRGDQKLFWDEANWAALCKPCHDAKTAREGRWG